jgi:phosphoserine phosphatase RsbU/P
VARDSLSLEGRAALGAASGLILFVTAFEIADGKAVHYVGWLSAAPFVAAAFVRWRYVVAIGTVCAALTAVFSLVDPDGFDPYAVIRVSAMMLATLVAVFVSVVRQRQEVRYAELSRLVAIAQEAVLRPIGPQIGQLAVAGRYVSASAAADIGGDLYEAVATRYGVRMIIGDVRGKGIDAIRLAINVLGSFRHAAFERAELRGVVTDLDHAVARSVGEEDFVTAALIEERGGTLSVYNCGHPAPLLLRRGQVIPLDPPTPAPPLGFGPVPQVRTERLEPGDRLLLYTDGLAEARRAGEFFPTADRAWALLGHGTVQNGLASLETALVEWVRGKLDDDIALLLLEYTGARPPAEPELPSWEIGGAPTPTPTRRPIEQTATISPGAAKAG